MVISFDRPLRFERSYTVPGGIHWGIARRFGDEFLVPVDEDAAAATT